MSETTLRLKAEANVKSVLDYADAVARMRAEVQGYTGDLAAYEAAVKSASATARASPIRPSKRVASPAAEGEAPASGESGGGGQAPASSGGSAGAPRSTRTATGASVLNDGYRGARGFIGQTAATAIGLGLGSSITGFVLGSGETYMQLSRILTTVDRRFRDTAGSAIAAGQAMGFTIAQAGQLSEAFGAQVNSGEQASLARYLGLGRFMGMDPNDAATELGGLQRVQGSPLGNNQLAALLGVASRQGMDQGRLSEFMRAITSLSELVLRTTGQRDVRHALTMAEIPRIVFGAGDSRGQGMAGVDFVNRLGDVMSSGGPMQSFMGRAMGYGIDPSMGYIEYRKRLHEGASPRNLADLFGAFRAFGWGETDQFKAIESVAGGRLSPHEIEALVQQFGVGPGVARLGMAGDPSAQIADFMASLSPRDQGLASRGFVAAGQANIPIGDAFQQQLESGRMAAGQYVAQAMIDLNSTIFDVVKILTNFTDINPGQLLTDLTGAIRDLAEAGRTMSENAQTVSRVRGGADTALGLVTGGFAGDPDAWTKVNALAGGGPQLITGSGGGP